MINSGANRSSTTINPLANNPNLMTSNTAAAAAQLYRAPPDSFLYPISEEPSHISSSSNSLEKTTISSFSATGGQQPLLQTKSLGSQGNNHNKINNNNNNKRIIIMEPELVIHTSHSPHVEQQQMSFMCCDGASQQHQVNVRQSRVESGNCAQQKDQICSRIRSGELNRVTNQELFPLSPPPDYCLLEQVSLVLITI